MASDHPSSQDPADPAAKPPLDRHERMPVGVFVERRKATTPWADYVWRPVAVVAGIPATEPWTIARQDDNAVQFYAGGLEIELFPRETVNYLLNLSMPEQGVYIVLGKDAAAPHGVTLRLATVSPSEAEAYMDGEHVVEKVPMPEAIEVWLRDYIAAYHVEEKFVKRKRKRHDPQKGFGRGSGHNDYGPSFDRSD